MVILAQKVSLVARGQNVTWHTSVYDFKISCPQNKVLVPFRGFFKISNDHLRHFYTRVPRGWLVPSRLSCLLCYVGSRKTQRVLQVSHKETTGDESAPGALNWGTIWICQKHVTDTFASRRRLLVQDRFCPFVVVVAVVVVIVIVPLVFMVFIFLEISLTESDTLSDDLDLTGMELDKVS